MLLWYFKCVYSSFIFEGTFLDTKFYIDSFFLLFCLVLLRCHFTIAGSHCFWWEDNSNSYHCVLVCNFFPLAVFKMFFSILFWEYLFSFILNKLTMMCLGEKRQRKICVTVCGCISGCMCMCVSCVAFTGHFGSVH